jgi:hypothetical protein
VTNENRPKFSLRERAKDVLWVIFVVLFVLTIPIGFPLLVLYSKVRGRRIRGKGIALPFFLWLVVTSVSSLLLAAYLKKGVDGLKTLGFILAAGLIWGIIVFLAIRIFVEVVALMFKLRAWLGKKFKR